MTAIFHDVYVTGQPAPVYETKIQRPDGSRFILESSASLLKSPEGEPIGFFGVSRDVTEKETPAKNWNGTGSVWKRW